jgi:hypothetical protein
MLTKINPALCCLLGITARILIKGASVGDSIALFAVCALYGYQTYVESRKEIPINDTIKQQVSELRDAINSLKVAKTFSGR